MREALLSWTDIRICILHDFIVRYGLRHYKEIILMRSFVLTVLLIGGILTAILAVDKINRANATYPEQFRQSQNLTGL